MDEGISGSRQQACSPKLLHERRRWVLYDQKWRKLLKRVWLFRLVPFIDFVFAAGSMATGNVNSDSDFDVIVGVRHGRMFTSRFLFIVCLDSFGWRRKNLDHGASAADTVCLNHFVTKKSYCLSKPHQKYWKLLYENLVPVFGDVELINDFWEANSDWMDGAKHYLDDLRHEREDFGFKIIIEKLLSGRSGDVLERFLKRPQIHRIESRLKPMAGYNPRLIYGDDELELHLDTRRIEAYK